MIEVKFIGSGGQGVVIAAKLLAQAAAMDGYSSQSFASYGAERRGGRVEAYVRISEEQIAIHSKMYSPDYIIIMDKEELPIPFLLPDSSSVTGLLINSEIPLSGFADLTGVRVVRLDADGIALRHRVMLPSGLPIINTTILGATIGLISMASFNTLSEVIKEANLPQKNRNIEAAREAYQIVTRREKYNGEEITEKSELSLEKSKPYPIIDRTKVRKCERCLVCFISCPDLAVYFETEPFVLGINHRLCKRCGICIEECPRKAIFWGENND